MANLENELTQLQTFSARLERDYLEWSTVPFTSSETLFLIRSLMNMDFMECPAQPARGW